MPFLFLSKINSSIKIFFLNLDFDLNLILVGCCIYRWYYLLFFCRQSFVRHMIVSFVVKWVYCCYLVVEARPLLDILALDIWPVYWLMIVNAVALKWLNDEPMAVIQILPTDLVLCLVNNRCLCRPI